MDVEELARVGRHQQLCPYYAARAMQHHADLVLLPYSCLLSLVRTAAFLQQLQYKLESHDLCADAKHVLWLWYGHRLGKFPILPQFSLENASIPSML